MGFSNKNLLAHVLVAHFLIIMPFGSTPPSLARAIINEDTGNEAQDLSKMFEEWMTKFHKVYSDEATKAQPFAIFKENWAYIQNFNKQGTESYTVGLNVFSDLTSEEFMANYGTSEEVIPNPPTAHSTSCLGHEDSEGVLASHKDIVGSIWVLLIPLLTFLKNRLFNS